MPENIREGEQKNRPCPVCQPEHRCDQTALSIRRTDGRILVHCHRSGCSFRDIMNALGIEPDRQVQPADHDARRSVDEQREKTERAGKIWLQSQRIEGTPAETYLRTRAITIQVDHRILRYHPRCYHPSRTYLPAMIARVQTVSGRGTAIHRTFLTPLGAKTDRNPQKAMLGPVRGGAVRLGDGEHVLLGEGIETVLSAMQLAGLPGYAALSATSMRNVELPEHVRQVTVLMDIDENGAGQAAAEATAQTIRKTGRQAEVVIPASGAADFNEYLMGLSRNE